MNMNKDFDLKDDRSYSYSDLRGRIETAIKQMREEADETQIPQSKRMPVIPVTGSGNSHKYFDNKTRDQLK